MGKVSRGFGDVPTRTSDSGTSAPVAQVDLAAGTGRRGCVVRTRSRHEQILVAELTRAGVSAWTPTVERVRRYGPYLLTVRQPLFPGHVFVECDAAELERLRSNARVVAVMPLATTRAAS